MGDYTETELAYSGLKNAMETANFTGLMAPPDSIDYRSDYVLSGAKNGSIVLALAQGSNCISKSIRNV